CASHETAGGETSGGAGRQAFSSSPRNPRNPRNPRMFLGARQGLTPNASRTLPGRSPNVPYPELTYTMPPATVGAGPFIDPPFARTPLTVLNSRLVSNVQTIAPPLVEYARTAPSFEGEKTMPGMTGTAAN